MVGRKKQKYVQFCAFLFNKLRTIPSFEYEVASELNFLFCTECVADDEVIDILRDFFVSIYHWSKGESAFADSSCSAARNLMIHYN